MVVCGQVGLGQRVVLAFGSRFRPLRLGRFEYEVLRVLRGGVVILCVTKKHIEGEEMCKCGRDCSGRSPRA